MSFMFIAKTKKKKQKKVQTLILLVQFSALVNSNSPAIRSEPWMVLTSDGSPLGPNRKSTRSLFEQIARLSA